MPIPLRDLSEEEAGTAGYLRFVDDPDGRGIRAALFVMSTRGEPLEFGFTKIGLRFGPLWRAEDVRRHAVFSLAKALFEAVVQVPDVLLALGAEAPSAVFAEDLATQVPLCRVVGGDTGAPGPSENLETVSDSLSLAWVTGAPAAESATRHTIDLLRGRYLLIEPFDRALKGLEEGLGAQ